MRTHLPLAAAAATLLASIGLYPLFETSGWFTGGMGAIIVAAAAGALGRRLRLPAMACPALSLAALLIYLTMMFAPGQALLGLVPTPGSVAHLARLAGDGRRAVNTYAAPVPVLPGIELLTVTGIGIVAIVVDLLAVRLRRAATAGLPLLAMYSVPAAIRQESVGWLAFLIGSAGYLTLLVVDARERLSHWGRPVLTRHWDRADRDGRPDSRALAVNGRRIGLTAMLCAVVVPVAIPGIRPHGLLGVGADGGGGHGLTTVTTPDPLVSLRRELVRADDSVVLTYRTSDGSAPDYLRMYALDRFDGVRWTYSPVRTDRSARIKGRTLPPAPGLTAVQTRPVTTKISIDRHVQGMNVLPAPYPPTKVDIRGDWRVDSASLMVFSLHDSAGGRTYTVSSSRPLPTYEQLRSLAPTPPGIGSRYTAVPGWIPDDIIALARKITSGAQTPYDKAVRLQEWFTHNFTYSLDVPPPRTASALHDFLMRSRTGYCEQFAASMALLARIVEVPSRVVVGYTAGARQPDGTWVVRTKDTHAWPELYLAGTGWLRFEPTPAGSTGQGTASVPDYARPAPPPGTPGEGAPATAPTTGPASGGQPTTGTGASPHRRPDPADRGDAAGPVPGSGGTRVPVGPVLAGLLAVALLAAPVLMRRMGRARRWTGARSDTAIAHAAWDELRADAIDHRLPWRGGDSPRAAVRRLTEALDLDDPAREALDRLALAEERARYAPEPAPAATLRDDLRVVRAAFAAGASRRTRWRARLMPPSATAALRRAGTRALDVFDRLDVLAARRRA